MTTPPFPEDIDDVRATQRFGPPPKIPFGPAQFRQAGGRESLDAFSALERIKRIDRANPPLPKKELVRPEKRPQTIFHDPNASIFPIRQASGRLVTYFEQLGGSFDLLLKSFTSDKKDQNAIAMSQLPRNQRLSLLMEAGWDPVAAREWSKEIDFVFGDTGRQADPFTFESVKTVASSAIGAFNAPRNLLLGGYTALEQDWEESPLVGWLPARLPWTTGEEAPSIAETIGYEVVKGFITPRGVPTSRLGWFEEIAETSPLSLPLTGLARVPTFFRAALYARRAAKTLKVATKAATAAAEAAEARPLRRLLSVEKKIAEEAAEAAGRIPAAQAKVTVVKKPQARDPGGRFTKEPLEPPELPQRLLYKEQESNLLYRQLLNSGNLPNFIKQNPVLRWLARIESPFRVISSDDVPASMEAVRQINNSWVVSQADAAGRNLKTIMQPLFKFDKEGIARAAAAAPNVDTTVPGFGTIPHMTQNLTQYRFTPAQMDVLRLASDTTGAQRKFAEDLGFTMGEVIEDAETLYWHSIVKKVPGGRNIEEFRSIEKLPENRPSLGGGGAAMERLPENVAVRMAEGYVYETDPFLLFSARLSSIGRAISNRRHHIETLALGPSPAERGEAAVAAAFGLNAELKAARKEWNKAIHVLKTIEKGKEATLKQTERVRNATRDIDGLVREQNLLSKGASRTRKVPGKEEIEFMGRIVPLDMIKKSEIANLLDQKGGDYKLVKGYLDAARLSQAFLTTMDHGAGFIQGQVVLYRNPVAWLRAYTHSITSIVNDLGPYRLKWAKSIEEGINVGAIMEPIEFVFGRTGLSSLPTRIPGAGSLFRGSNRLFQNFIFVAQHELYLAKRAKIMRSGRTIDDATEDLISAGSAIRKLLGTESYALLGVQPNQQMGEALAFFAARFLRANLGILAQAFTRGEGGFEARRSMGHLFAGAAGLTFAINTANGDRTNLIDPYAPDFWQFRVPGTTTRLSALGPFFPILRAGARVGVSIVDGDFAEAKNQAARFGLGKASVASRAGKFGYEVATGADLRTFEGEEIKRTPAAIAKHIGTEFFLPLAGEEMVRGIFEGHPEKAIELTGLIARSTPYSQLDALYQMSGDLQEYHPDGGTRSLNNAPYYDKVQMMRQHPEIAAKMTERQQGKFGMLARSEKELREERNAELLAEYDLVKDNIASGVVGVAQKFRTFYKSYLSDEFVARMQARQDFKAFSNDEFKPQSDTDEALKEYWNFFHKTEEEGGARLGDGVLGNSVNPDLLDKLIKDWREDWTEEALAKGLPPGEILDRVDEVTGPRDLPPQLQPYADLDRKLQRLNWYDLYENSPTYVNGSPFVRQAYLEYRDQSRLKQGDLWLRTEHKAAHEWMKKLFDRIDNEAKAQRRELQLADPELDLAYTELAGGVPQTLEVRRSLAFRNVGIEQVVNLTNIGGTARIDPKQVTAMMNAGINSLEDLARANAEKLALQRNLGVELARHYIFQAKRLLVKPSTDEVAPKSLLQLIRERNAA